MQAFGSRALHSGVYKSTALSHSNSGSGVGSDGRLRPEMRRRRMEFIIVWDTCDKYTPVWYTLINH